MLSRKRGRQGVSPLKRNVLQTDLKAKEDESNNPPKKKLRVYEWIIPVTFEFASL